MVKGVYDHSPSTYSQYLGPLSPQAIFPYSPRFCGPGVYLQRHALRDRRSGTVANLRLAERWGQRNCIVYSEEKIFCTRAAGQNKNILDRHYSTSPTNQPRKNPFHLSSLSTHAPRVSTVGRGHPSLVSMYITHEHLTSSLHSSKIFTMLSLLNLFCSQGGCVGRGGGGRGRPSPRIPRSPSDKRK